MLYERGQDFGSFQKSAVPVKQSRVDSPFLTTDERPVFAPDGLRTGGVCFFGLELEFPIFDSRLTACGEISVPFYSQSILQEFEKSVG